MSTTIQYKEEGKEIINKVENLTPWDKAEIIRYLAEKILSWEEFEAYFILGSGYVKYEDLDIVNDVIQNNLEEEVLDSMDENDICDYLLNGPDMVDNLRRFLEYMSSKDAAESIDKTNMVYIESIIDDLKENYNEKYVKLKEYFNKDE